MFSKGGVILNLFLYLIPEAPLLVGVIIILLPPKKSPPFRRNMFCICKIKEQSNQSSPSNSPSNSIKPFPSIQKRNRRSWRVRINNTSLLTGTMSEGCWIYICAVCVGLNHFYITYYILTRKSGWNHWWVRVWLMTSQCLDVKFSVHYCNIFQQQTTKNGQTTLKDFFQWWLQTSALGGSYGCGGKGWHKLCSGVSSAKLKGSPAKTWSSGRLTKFLCHPTVPTDCQATQLGHQMTSHNGVCAGVKGTRHTMPILASSLRLGPGYHWYLVLGIFDTWILVSGYHWYLVLGIVDTWFWYVSLIRKPAPNFEVQ